MATNYPRETPRSRTLGAARKGASPDSERERRARRRREKQGWADVNDTVQDAHEDWVEVVLQKGTCPDACLCHIPDAKSPAPAFVGQRRDRHDR